MHRLCVLLLAALLGFSTSAWADWRQEVPVLRVGVMTGPNANYRLGQLEPFRFYLEGKLMVPVELVPLPDYPAVIDAQASKRIHYAIESAGAYAMAVAACNCVEPLAVPAREGGESGFHAVLLARADSTIRSLADAKDARLALAGKDSVAGRLLPLKALAKEGFEPAEIVDSPDPSAAVRALLSGEADLAAAWSSLGGNRAEGYSFGTPRDLVAEGALSMDDVRVVWQSALVPFGPHVVGSGLPGELKDRLKESLLAMAVESPAAYDAVDRAGGQGFVAVKAEAFAPVLELVKPD